MVEIQGKTPLNKRVKNTISEREYIIKKGEIGNTIQSILGGVRSACSYVGARRIKDLPKCTTFVRVTITTNEIYTSHEVS